jgi:hypothetical protein
VERCTFTPTGCVEGTFGKNVEGGGQEEEFFIACNRRVRRKSLLDAVWKCTLSGDLPVTITKMLSSGLHVAAKMPESKEPSTSGYRY